MSRKDFKGLGFCRISDGRMFTIVRQDPCESVPTILIQSCIDGGNGKPPEHDIVLLSHHDDFISETGKHRYDLVPVS